MNNFKKAVINKLRIRFNGSTIMTEDLCDLPLQSNSHVSLDKIAISLNNQIKSMETESFVKPNTDNQASADIKLAFEIVKEIIADKQSANEAKRDSKIKADKIERLDALIEAKKSEADSEKSLDQLQEERNSL